MKHLIKFFLISIISSAFILSSIDLYSRAGRGQSYRSSSSSSSSSRRSSYSSSSSYKRSSSSSSSRSYTYPGGYHSSRSYTSSSSTSQATDGDAFMGLIIFFIIIGIIVFVIYKIVKKAKNVTSNKQEDAEYSKGPTYNFNENILQIIKQEDPNFSTEHFFKHVSTIAEKLQNAWSEGDMLPVRNYVSQGVYNRFKLQLELMLKQEGIHNIVANFQIKNLSVISISTSHSYQTLHTKLTARAKDATVDANASNEQKQKAINSATPEEFVEIYSFTRKRGAVTDFSKSYLAGQCPSCGYIPDNFGEVNKCPSCGSVYNSGEFDWVLSEITQQEEWNETSGDNIEGLQELETKNISINRQVIEDRASYLFWRWIYAQAMGANESITRDITPEFLSSFNIQKIYMAEIAVGSVDLEAVWQDNDTAFALVLILWSASFAKNSEPLHKEHRFTLKMPMNLKNPYGLADHSCNSCGGPLPETDALTCSYCGSNLPTVVSDWLLDKIEEIE